MSAESQGASRLEEALQQSEARFRTIVSTAFEGIWMVDTEARTVYANDRMAEMLGCSQKDLESRRVFDFLFPGEDSIHAEHIGKNLLGSVEQFDARFRRADGSDLLVLACTSPVHDAGGGVVGALGLFTDITERVRAERQREELLERERDARNRLTLLADASALLASSLDYETTLSSLARAVVPAIADWCAVHLVDQDGSVRQIAVVHRDPEKVRLARELERQYPFDPDAPTGVPNVLRTGRNELLRNVTDDLLESAAPDRFVLGILRELGIKSWMIVPLETRGRVLGAVTFIGAESGRSYTEDDLALAEVLARRAALAIDNAALFQEARRAAAERTAILTQMTDGVIMCDPDGVVTFMNVAARDLYGADFSGNSLAGYRNTPDLRDRKGDAYSARSLPMARALAGETVVAEEARMTRADGALLVLQRSATPITAPDGTLLGAVISVRDVTTERSLEAQKDAFLSAAAHDLRTPLTSIKGMAQVLRRRLRRDQSLDVNAISDDLARIEHNASRMTSIITELIDLSRTETGERLPLNLHRVDLVDVVTRCVEYQREGAAGQRIELDIRTRGISGVLDSDRIERAVTNLLSNATKYSPDLTPVIVSVGEELVCGSTWAVIRVSDCGVGIPQEDMPHIFKRFHRGGNVSPDMSGTGIGLAGARQIVEQHGGTIEVQSVEGAGSTFTIRLPVVDDIDTAGRLPEDKVG